MGNQCGCSKAVNISNTFPTSTQQMVNLNPNHETLIPILPLMNPNPEEGGGDDGSTDDADRFSNLPEHLIHYIFSFMETIDVMRARAVSRKWRYLCLSIPYLNLDICSFAPRSDIQFIKFKNFVNWVFMTQNGSIDIETLYLHYYHPPDNDDYTLYTWISAMTRRNVKDLDLNFVEATIFELPQCLVNCESLIALRIDHCGLHLPPFTGFRRLKSLELVEVMIYDYDLLGKLISSCPVLVNLVMERFIGWDAKNLNISTASLKNISIGPRVHLYKCDLKIDCPNLEYFNFISPPALNFNFHNLNSLHSVYMNLGYAPFRHKQSSRIMFNFFKAICNVEDLDLCIDGKVLYGYDDPKCFSTSFHNLRFLTLTVYTDDWNVLLIINFLHCSPNLEGLTVSFDWCEPLDLWKKPDTALSSLPRRLRMVELLNVEANESEFELMKFLLKNGHVLERMSIEWMWNSENRAESSEKVMQFPRSSPNVELTFF